MAGNASLAKARRAKQDEFYTLLSDIENECGHYTKHFEGKTILCNCDDPFESNFFKYFALNFNNLKLKKLIATCYASSPVSNTQLSVFDTVCGVDDAPAKSAYKIVITEVNGREGEGVALADVENLIKSDGNVLSVLKGDGDFRSEECVELLKEADIVVTNPPFSLFREYMAQLMEYDKKFLIVGGQNMITNRDFFPLIRESKVWLGYMSGSQKFLVPGDYEGENVFTDAEGHRMASFGNICWFTNLETPKKHETLKLYSSYSPDKYPKYDNYDAIDVPAVKEIPADYFGIMGVPISFMEKHSPDQFEIIWQASGNTRASAPKEVLKEVGYKASPQDRGGCGVIDGVRKYSRILIRRKIRAEEENCTPAETVQNIA